MTTIDVGELRTQFRIARAPGTAAAPSNGTGSDGQASSNGNGKPQMTNRLRLLRGDYAWSQAELARRLGVSRQTVNALERGKYHPSLPLAFKISRLFERPIEEVFRAHWESGHNGE
jgi:putative transcriptional regulator